MSNFSFGSLSQIAFVGSAALSYLFSDQQDTGVKFVDLGYAKYQTNISLAEGVTSFLGVRYGASPTENLRFHAPQAPFVIEELQMATTQPPPCWSLDATAQSPSEDCLFLNVHLPASSAQDVSEQNKNGLPVLVFVHGGGYKHGSAAWYPAEKLVRDSGHGLIAVNIQYRLGAFGFLSGKDVKDDGALNVGLRKCVAISAEKYLNFRLVDQKLALEWIQKYIRTFGGDPNRVTVLGHSAGAGSVMQHLVAQGGESTSRLFQTAMLSSPFLPPQYDYNDPTIERAYRTLAERANCPLNHQILSCLRSLSAEELRNASFFPGFKPLYNDFPPVVDGSYIQERPTITLAKKKVNAESLLVFTNTNEAAMFVQPAEIDATLATFITKLLPRLPEDEIARAVHLYLTPTATRSDIYQAAIQIKSEFYLVCPAYWVLNAFRERNAWKGTFAIAPGVHSLDLNYIFKDANIYQLPATFLNEDFGQALRHAYLGTATKLSPNGAPDSITPMWPQYQYGGARTEMLFNQTEDGEPDVRAVQTDPELQKRCSFWYSVTEYTFQ